MFNKYKRNNFVLCVLHNRDIRYLCISYIKKLILKLSAQGEIMKAYYYTFGCKVNSYETENIREAMQRLGYEDTDTPSQAEVCIVNSCAVTGEAVSKCRQLLRKLRREAPDAVIALSGCYAQAFAEESKALPECDIIVGSRNKSELPSMIMQFLESREREISILPHEKGQGLEPMQNLGDDRKTRAFIKIQDGCDQYCTYCIIPFARGHICSKKPEDIAAETQLLVQSGHKEIILTGINMCCYGKDLGDIRLPDAVRAACSAEGDYRVRLSSLEPELLTDEDIRALAENDKLCPHFHLSLQSGCDKTLKRMNRHYNSAQYAEIVLRLREAFPSCAITTDVMAGFPGESEDDHRQSLEFVKSIAFAGGHVFPYSRREGTAADRFPEQVDQHIKNERARELREVIKASQLEYNRSQTGKTVRVLFERENSEQFHRGHSPEYINVRTERKTSQSLWRCFADVRIISADENGCFGEIV